MSELKIELFDPKHLLADLENNSQLNSHLISVLIPCITVLVNMRHLLQSMSKTAS